MFYQLRNLSVPVAALSTAAVASHEDVTVRRNVIDASMQPESLLSPPPAPAPKAIVLSSAGNMLTIRVPPRAATSSTAAAAAAAAPSSLLTSGGIGHPWTPASMPPKFSSATLLSMGQSSTTGATTTHHIEKAMDILRFLHGNNNSSGGAGSTANASSDVPSAQNSKKTEARPKTIRFVDMSPGEKKKKQQADMVSSKPREAKSDSVVLDPLALPDVDDVAESAPLPQRKPLADKEAEDQRQRVYAEASKENGGVVVPLEEMLEMDRLDRAELVRLSWRHAGIRLAFQYHFELRPVALRDGIKLFEYQKGALLWLYERERAKPVHGIVGGVLNADMGLGKSLMMMMHIFWRPRGEFPALAVASNAVMLEWKTQLEKFFEPEFIAARVLFMHRSLQPNLDKLTRADLEGKDLVVTTYDQLLSTYKKLPAKYIDYCVEYVSAEKRNKVATIHCRSAIHADVPQWKGELLLYGTPWDLVVRDESQRIANPVSKTFYSNMLLYGRCKWLMTGTLVRNYLKDIFSQLRAIGYDGVEKAREWTLARARQCYSEHKLANVIYRLTYEDASVELPVMHDVPVYVQLNTAERAIYEILEQQAKTMFDAVIAKMAAYNDIRVMILRLRQVCIAPWLLNARGALDDAETRPDIDEEDEDDGGTGRGRGIKRAREASDSEAPPSKRPRKNSFVIDEASASSEDIGSESSNSVSSDSSDESDSSSSSNSEEVDIDQLVGITTPPVPPVPAGSTEGADFLAAQGQMSLFDYCRDMDGGAGIGASKVTRALQLIEEFFTNQPKRKMIIFSMFTSVLTLVERAIRLKQGKEALANGSNNNAANGFQCVLWSEELRVFNIATVDGSTRGTEREELIFSFRNDPSIRILLLQGKIGGEGLNLQEASHDMQVTGMIIMEPHWTRQAKRQQKRRIHRIGQKHETWCWELIVADSVEDRVLELCDEKDKIEANFMHRQRGRATAGKGGALTMANIGKMLGRHGK